jgi:hypothetical protein
VIRAIALVQPPPSRLVNPDYGLFKADLEAEWNNTDVRGGKQGRQERSAVIAKWLEPAFAIQVPFRYHLKMRPREIPGQSQAPRLLGFFVG